jgi:hypothetical protein
MNQRHTKQLKRAKLWANQRAVLTGKPCHVVSARSGYYVGYTPQADPNYIVYVAKP